MYVKKLMQNGFCEFCAALAVVLFTTLIENLILCSSAEAAKIVLNLFSKNEHRVLMKLL